jgi:hypothetical protein
MGTPRANHNEVLSPAGSSVGRSPGEHWDGSGQLANYVKVGFERVLPVENALPTEVLKRQIPEQNWG